MTELFEHGLVEEYLEMTAELLAPLKERANPADEVESTVQRIMLGHTACQSPLIYRDAIREALETEVEMSQLIALNHSEKKVRTYLKSLERALTLRLECLH